MDEYCINTRRVKVVPHAFVCYHCSCRSCMLECRSSTCTGDVLSLVRSGTMLRSGVPVGASPSRMDVDYRPIGVLVLGVTLASLLAASVHRRKSGKTPKRSGLARRAVAGASAIGRFDPGNICLPFGMIVRLHASHLEDPGSILPHSIVQVR